MEDIGFLSVIPLIGILLLGNFAVWIRMKLLCYSRKQIILGLIIGNVAFLIVVIYGIVMKLLDN